MMMMLTGTKYVVKYLIRLIQIGVFLLVSLAALYLIFLALKAGFSMIWDIELKGDIIVKGIPVLTAFIIIVALIPALIAVKVLYLVCSMLLMLINGSLGDIIEYMNIPKSNSRYRDYLIFRKGGLLDIIDADQHTRKYLLRSWWKGF